MTETKTKGLSADVLKIIAIIAMTLDHAAPVLASADSPLGILIHFFGRFTAPIMCYFIAEGYHYTHDVKKYALRLFLFAAISQVPYQLLFGLGNLLAFPPQISMIFTLFCGLLALIAWDRIENIALRLLAVIALCAVTWWADWQIFGVLFILAFGVFYGDKKKKMTAFALFAVAKIIYNVSADLITGHNPIVELSKLGLFCVIPLLLLYNGTRKKSAWRKWFFYIYYPAHLLSFAVVNLLVIGFKG
jgi:hypothetical protein